MDRDNLGYNCRMKPGQLPFLFLVILMMISCAITAGGEPAPTSPAPVDSPTSAAFTETVTPFPPTQTFTPPPTDTPAPTETPTETPIPTVENLNAIVTTDKLSCRYGPGAEYLYLYALNGTAKIKLIGRTDANNWVWVDGDNRCWVNAKFLTIEGDPRLLPVVYPGLKLPVSPYYPGPAWAKPERKDGKVIITWEAVPISPGKYEDENMHQYIIEVWRCEAGRIIFETLGTNFPFITIDVDQAGCAVPSHGRVFVQEKHGYGGPIEIPWPSP